MTTATEIADKIAATQNLTMAQAKAIVDGVFKEIASAAASGAETNIPGFGKFKVKATPAREGRNPATGGTIKDRGLEEVGLRAGEGREGRAQRLRPTSASNARHP